MALSILEALQNADYNLSNNGILGARIAQEQVHNVYTLLEKGYGLNENIGDILSEYENVEDAPKK